MLSFLRRRPVPRATRTAALVLLTISGSLRAQQVGAAHARHAHPAVDTTSRATHRMAMLPLGRGWSLTGMAQAFPTLTAATPWINQGLASPAGIYLTQPAVMMNVSSRSSRLVLRATLNGEGALQPDGELTFGGWGEGFIDSRHPHTLVHEAMFTANAWRLAGGSVSISAGKGFVPYGTDDPMGRPVVKFPTNHHLSQILERYTANLGYLRNGWGIEGGLFAGAEPNGPYDLDNHRGFGDSWAIRLSSRFGSEAGPAAPWELSASYADVADRHHDEVQRTSMFNAALRHNGVHRFGSVYGLAEWSRSMPRNGAGHYAALIETQLRLGADRHQPYLRVERSTRPEYERAGAPGSPGFFRYREGAHETGATAWTIISAGYAHQPGRALWGARPFVEVQYNSVASARGGVEPRALFGSNRFWSVSSGVKLFAGGGPMRMGSYGSLDPMTAAMR